MARPDSSDAALLYSIGAGDEDAFVELYSRRRPDIYRFAYAMSRSDAVAEDVVQDVFLNVLRNASRFDAAKGSVRAWLFGCARHMILDRARHDGRWSAASVEEPSEPCGGEDAVFEQQRAEGLLAAIASLPPEYRETIVLCELEELAYAEAAAVLACPVGTVRSRLHRARRLLAARLEASAAAPALKTSEACS